MTQPAVLVIGDVMLDSRVEGEMTRVSPEAPAPIVRTTQRTATLGGAGNVARNIVAMGHPVYLLAAVGGDAAGGSVTRLSLEAGVAANYARLPGATIVKQRITCGGQILLRVDDEDPQIYPKVDFSEHVATSLDSLNLAAGGVRLVVISDYGKGFINRGVLDAVDQACREHGIPIFLDPYPPHRDMYNCVALIKPNLEEAAMLLEDDVHFGLAASNDVATRADCACTQLEKHFSGAAIVVTTGSGGCCYKMSTAGSQPYHVSAWGPAGVDVVKDICGAGDTVMAALAAGYMEGKDLHSSAELAMHAAGYVVQFHGVHIAQRDAVEDFVYEHSNYTKKLMTHEEVLRFLERKRKTSEGGRIALANGCFDGFHAAHLETFRYARQHADILLVAYNDDESLRAVKGEGRPHVPDSFRATHIALQEPVDAVFRFDGDVEKLVRVINPDILVKGGDTPAPVAGEEYVTSYGGRVERAYTSFRVVVSRETEFVPISDI